MLKAYSLELPIIGTKVTGVKDFIEDGKSGYLIESGNEIELSELISTLCNRPEKSLEMSDYYSGLVPEKCSWSKIVDVMLHVYNRLQLFRDVTERGVLYTLSTLVSFYDSYRKEYLRTNRLTIK